MSKFLVGLVVCVWLCRYFKYSSASDSSEVKSLLNATEIEIILQQHNDFRRSVTPSASDMRALSWSEKLADLAQAYSNKCIFKHSVKASLAPYGYIGENIYIGNERYQTFSNEEIARPVVAWYNETEFYDFTSNACQEQKVCGHYTQTVWAKTYHLGCGRTRCNGNIPVGSTIYQNPIIVVCKYGPTGNTKKLFQSHAPYKAGSWCSRCPKEAPVCDNRLCDVERNSFVTSKSVSPGTTTRSRYTTTTVISTPLSSVAMSTSKTTTPTLPVEFPFTPGRKLVTVNLVAVNRMGVQNALPFDVQRPEVDILLSKPVGLLCYVCNGGDSVGQCVSKNETMVCEDKRLTVGMAGTNQDDWSCAKFNKDNKIEMKCIPTTECKQIMDDGRSDAECCHTDFCNDATITRSSITMLSLLNIFILLVFCN